MARPIPREPPVTNATRSVTTDRSCVRAPPEQRAGPCHTGPEAGTEDEVPLFDAAVVDGFEQRERDRCRRRVAVAVDVHEGAVGFEAEALRGRVDDAGVRLMRDEPVHGFRLDVGACERGARGFHDDAYCALEDL